MIITSKENDEIKKIKKLYEKKYRQENKMFIVDGIKLVKEAIEEKASIEEIIICKELLNNNNQLIDKKFLETINNYKVIETSLNVFKTISELQTPQGIIAIIKTVEDDEKIDFNEDLFIILDDIQDPGNIGTIIRTADAAGIKQIIASSKTADCYNSKVIRSTMGSIFRVKVIYKDNLIETINELKKNNIKIIATDLEARKDIYETDFKKSAIVIGNEANGISKEILDLSDEKVIIPMKGSIESLNAAVATGIIVFEARRKNR